MDKERFARQLKAEQERLKDLGFYTKYFEYVKKEDGSEGFYVKREYNTEKYLTEAIFDDILLQEADYKTNLWNDIRIIIGRTKALDSLVSKELKRRFNIN